MKSSSFSKALIMLRLILLKINHIFSHHAIRKSCLHIYAGIISHLLQSLSTFKVTLLAAHCCIQTNMQKPNFPGRFLQTRVSVFATFTFSPPFSRHLCHSFNLFWSPLFFVFITTRSSANSSSHISSPLSSSVNSSTMMANNSGLNADPWWSPTLMLNSLELFIVVYLHL